MKFHYYISHVLLICFTIAFSISNISLGIASTIPTPPSVIVIVNSDQIFSQSKVGQNVRSQIQSLAKKLQAESQKSEEALKIEAKNLSEQRRLLSESDFGKKVQSFEEKQQNFQRTMQQRSQELQLGSNKARGEIEAVVRPIFADVMTAHGANILLDQSVVLAGGVDFNVTTEVLQALDAKLTSVTVKSVPLSSLKK
jgi:Skp family chaperone for outer membrane proteins